MHLHYQRHLSLQHFKNTSVVLLFVTSPRYYLQKVTVLHGIMLHAVGLSLWVYLSVGPKSVICSARGGFACCALHCRFSCFHSVIILYNADDRHFKQECNDPVIFMFLITII